MPLASVPYPISVLAGSFDFFDFAPRFLPVCLFASLSLPVSLPPCCLR
jgi:hypothetical protein